MRRANPMRRAKPSSTVSVASSEQSASVQEEMFRTLLQTPHRKVDEIINIHQTQYERDPNFYGHLATYAVHKGNCVVRDVNEVFIAQLFTSAFEEHRKAAFVMLQSLPPYEVARVMRYVVGYDEVVNLKSIDPPLSKIGITVTPARYSKKHSDPAKRGQKIPTRIHRLSKVERSKLQAAGKIKHGDKSYTVDSFFVKHKGFGKKAVTGQLHQSIKTYLAFRELPENENILTGTLMRAKKTMKELYSRSNTLPLHDENSWVNKYLFHNKTIKGTRLHALRLLADNSDPTEQAKIIIDNKIPFPVASSLIKNMTPSVLVALIEVMSSQELMSSMGMLTKRGATQNPDVKSLIEKKLKGIKEKGKARVDALKGAFAAKSVENLDENLAMMLADITDTQLKHHGKVKARTAILIDKSGSMEDALELGKELAAVIAQSCEDVNNLRVYLFDSTPTEIRWDSSDGDITTKSAWDRKLKMFRANGGTDPSQVVRAMILNKIVVDQLLLVTDEGENTEGKFARQLKDYEKEIGFSPAVVIVRVGGEHRRYEVSDRMEKTCKSQGFNVDVLRCEKIDQVAIPNLLQLLSRKSIFELIQEIMNTPLPVKSDLKRIRNFDKVLQLV